MPEASSHQPLIFLEREAVRHAGKVVGHGTVYSVAVGQAAKLQRQALGLTD